MYFMCFPYKQHFKISKQPCFKVVCIFSTFDKQPYF